MKNPLSHERIFAKGGYVNAMEIFLVRTLEAQGGLNNDNEIYD